MEFANVNQVVANFGVHLLRVSLVGCLLALLYRPQQSTLDESVAPPLDAIRGLMPDAATVSAQADAAGCWEVRAEDGKVLGRVARTFPAAASSRGYRGATEAILAVDPQNLITGVDILFSLDTVEHVAAVRQDRDFLNQFVGWKMNAPVAGNIDAVSGATLTSLAMARGILARLGETPKSLIFPEPLNQQESQFVRTGPLVDNVIGYQGPTELLLDISDQGVVEKIMLRKSFDNEPYVGYVVEDRYFWNLFQGKSIEDLARFDLVEQQVEGVSGATMTSQAIPQTLVQSAKELQFRAQPKEAVQAVGWRDYLTDLTRSPAEVATIVLVFTAGLFSWLGLHRRRGWRLLWLSSVFVVLGVWAGNLLSMSLLVGWSSAGAAATVAPGLAFLIGVAMLWPPLTKSNTYCSHLCPHGAIQQIIRPQGVLDRKLLRRGRRRWQLHLEPRWQRVLKWIPGATLAVAYLLVLLRPETDLASWEPFHAYLYPIASFATIVIFSLSLLISAFLPMGYCRFGCPTGSLLDYLRRTGNSRKVSWVDCVLFGLLVFALVPRFFTY